MPTTYTIVAENKTPLGTNEIAAGTNITPTEGDIYIITAGADKNTTFDATGGVNFEIQFNTDNTNAFDITIQGETNPTVTIADGVQLPNLYLKAEGANSINLDIGDGVLLDNFHGSNNGDDTVTIGDDFVTNNDFDTRGGNDSITIGSGANLNGKKIEGGGDNDTLTTNTDGLDISNVETVITKDGVVDGTTGDDTMNVGFIDAQTDQSGATDDTIVGNRGNDSIQGGDGADTIFGDFSEAYTAPPAPAPGAEVDTVIINNADVDNGNGSVDIDISTFADPNNANDVSISDSSSETITTITVSKIGAGDGQEDVIRFDLSTFDDDFTINVASEREEDTILLEDVIETIDNGDGTFSYTFWGDDNALHTVTVDAGVATPVAYQEDPEDAPGNTFDDTIDGGAGNDSIDGGGGADSLIGGADDDTIRGGTGADTIEGGTGADSIDGGSGVSAAAATDVGDDIDGGAGNDTIFGNAGDDTIEGGEGSDQIDGGTGADSITDSGGALSNDMIDGGAGNDTIDAGAGADDIDGGSGDDSIQGGSGNDTITGGASTEATEAGRVAFNWSNIPDPDDGGQIDNLDTVTSASQTVGGTTVNVTTTGGGAQYETTTVYTTGIDSGTGSVNTNSSLGLDGQDTFVTMDFTNPVENVEFRINDFEANSETLQISVYDENNNLISFNVTEGSGVNGTNTDAVAGNDQFQGPLSNTGDNAASGSILVQIPGPVSRIEIDYTQTNGSLTMTDVWFDDPASGTPAADSGNDTIDGGTGADSIDGEEGDDSLLGGTGEDTINGGDGDDFINGGADADQITGGQGSDTIALTDGFGNDVIDGSEDAGDTDTDLLDLSGLTEGVDVTFGVDPEDGTVVGGTSGDTATFSNIENIFFTEEDDTIDGSAAGTPINIDAAGGDDSIIGSAGDDTLAGGAGNDSFNGGDGSDSLLGGAGNDDITVDQGDTAEGGDGDDFFSIADLDTSGAGNAAISIIGGEGAEFGGDTLRLTPDIGRDDISFTIDDPVGKEFAGSFTTADGTVITFSEIENIICFTPGTRILTVSGERPIESLKLGDMVVTRDHGPQPIRWIGNSTVPGRSRFAPVRLSADALPGATRDLLVSPQHRMLFSGYQPELFFGESEVLVPAKHLVDGRTARVEPCEHVTYIHIMFDQHEIIYAENVPTESFHAGDVGISAICEEAREELFGIFPELRSAAGAHSRTARHCLRKHEAALLTSMTSPHEDRSTEPAKLAS